MTKRHNNECDRINVQFRCRQNFSAEILEHFHTEGATPLAFDTG